MKAVMVKILPTSIKALILTNPSFQFVISFRYLKF